MVVFYYTKGIGGMNLKPLHSYKRGRFGWTVFDARNNQIVLTNIPTKLRAMYACARLNGVDLSTVFNCGDALLK